MVEKLLEAKPAKPTYGIYQVPVSKIGKSQIKHHSPIKMVLA